MSAKPPHLLLVEALFYDHIAADLRRGAERAVAEAGATCEIISVPGSFEIPPAIAMAAKAGAPYDGYVALGCVIRGETTHYEHIATEVTRGIGQSAQETGVPHAYGVLTCENLEQAIDRAGLKSGNKGWEAALTAVEMVSLHGKLKRGASDGR